MGGETDSASFGDLCSNVGLPTARCAVLFWILWQDREEHRKERTDTKYESDALLANIQNSNREIISRLETSIEKNTEAIEKLENLVYKLTVHVDDIRDDISDNKKGR